MTIAGTTAKEAVSIEIGGMTIALRTDDPSFRKPIENRYLSFLATSQRPQLEFEIDLCEPPEPTPADDDVQVKMEAGEWLLQRGDFRARWRPQATRGHIRQSCNPYAIDSVLRIVHTLMLARQGGFLVHAASAIRGEKAFLFAGVSGAGKTTICRLAPSDSKLLSDEISYVRREGSLYLACGTPFAGRQRTAAPHCRKLWTNKSVPNLTLLRIWPDAMPSSLSTSCPSTEFFEFQSNRS
jgi:hypothetical protein